MEELLYNIPCVDDDDDDDDYNSPLPTEYWNTECDEYAAFIDHRRMWTAVMTELGMIRPLERVEKGQRSSKLLDAYIEHRWMWAAVMAEAVKARRPRTLLDRRGRFQMPLVLAP